MEVDDANSCKLCSMSPVILANPYGYLEVLVSLLILVHGGAYCFKLLPRREDGY